MLLSPYAWLLPLLCLIGPAYSVNILAIFPHHGLSHFMNVKPYLLELARRGHNLTVISFFPLKAEERPAGGNYHDVSLDGCMQLYNNNVSFARFEDKGFAASLLSPTQLNLAGLYMMADETLAAIFKAPELSRFIRSVLTEGHNFDLAIIETFQMDVFLGLIHRMGVPFISVTTCNLFSWSADRIGQPQNPSYVPTNIDLFGDHMTLIERIKNTISLLTMSVVHPLFFLANDQRMAEAQFGPGLPPLAEIAKNTSLLLANVHFSLNRPRPVVPQMIEVGGLHIAPAKPLPKDLAQFLDASTQGVIYFCMGSLLRGESFPKEKLQAFLSAFSQLPLNVLWKYEGAELPGKPSNVKILPWTPQRDILSHPNIKLFINHGGLLGTTEAVYEGVPLLGIPMFGDQPINMKAVELAGAGVILDYASLSQQTILEGIRTVLKPEYKFNMRLLQAQYRDRPMSAMDTAIFWTEYVIRHKGAPHLRTAAVHMPWYQTLCLDVALVFITVLLAVVFCIKLSITLVLRKLCSSNSSTHKNKKD
nr:UDP-glycosyltransferase UGT382A1 [Diaphorina citri]